MTAAEREAAIQSVLDDDPDLPWKRFPLAPDGDLSGFVSPAVRVELLDEMLDELDAVDLEEERERSHRERNKRNTWVSWRDQGTVPVMLLVLGVDTVNWTPSLEEKQAPCPVCGGRPLGMRTLCLSCLRSGVDARLPVVKPLPKEASKKYVPARGLKGGIGA